MPYYFNPKPNFEALCKYYAFSTPAKELQTKYIDGYPIVIDRYETEEKVAEITVEFTTIIVKHNLSEHLDNLLYLSLLKLQDIEAVMYELNFQYSQKQRTKELANLLLNFAETPIKDYNSILLKTFKATTKIADRRLINWIYQTSLQAIKDGKLPLTDFEYNIKDLFFDISEDGFILNLHKLKIEAGRTVSSPNRKMRTLHADFCFYLYPYFINETNIRPNQEVLISDAMKRLYYDLLHLFEYIDPQQIGSDPEDFMSSLLRNRINSLNPHLQGNKKK